ncbi:MAG: rod shape-determining protein RodA [Candidatus Harrisonbacteria bacterium]|nr:rod shape-determining protein RodA [Candidatus Harrisonbacteria bacterium]
MNVAYGGKSWILGQAQNDTLMMAERFFIFRRFDWLLALFVFLLAGLGLLTISTISHDLFYQQLIWNVIGVVLAAMLVLIDWRSLMQYRWFVFLIYFIGIALLIATFFFAPTIRGTRSWLVFGPVRFQTAEFAKMALIIFFSYFFARRHVGIGQIRNIIVSFFYFLLPALFVFIQPDMGSMLVMFGIWFGYLIFSGMRMRHLLTAIMIVAVVVGIGWFSFLKPYQKERIIGLFDPSYDPLGVNYSVNQAKIAVGSAGFFGKGLYSGTQVQLGFLPEAGTDFIFPAFVEEWGIFGMIILFLLYLGVFWRLYIIGTLASGNFSKLLLLGFWLLMLIHITFNLGSALGLLPVIGVPLSFMSYGGSHALIVFLLFGFSEGVASRMIY